MYRATFTLPDAPAGQMDRIVHALTDAHPEDRPCGYQHQATASVFYDVDAHSLPGAWHVAWQRLSNAWRAASPKRPWPSAELSVRLSPVQREPAPDVVDTEVERIGATAEPGW